MSIYGKNYIDVINQDITDDVQLQPEAGFFDAVSRSIETDFNYSREIDLTKEDHDQNYNKIQELLGNKTDTQEGKEILDQYNNVYRKIKFDEYKELKNVIDNGEEQQFLGQFIKGMEAGGLTSLLRDPVNSYKFLENNRKINAIKQIDDFINNYNDNLLSMKQIQENGKRKYYQRQREDEILNKNAGIFDSTVGSFTGSLLADPALATKRLFEGDPIHFASYLIPGGAGKAGLTLLQNLGRRTSTGFAAGFGAEFTLQMTEETRFQQEFLENKDFGMDDVLLNSTVGGIFNATFAGGVGAVSDAVKRRYSNVDLGQEIEASLTPYIRKNEEQAELFFNENKREKSEVEKLDKKITNDFTKLKNNVNHIYNNAINSIGQRKQDIKNETLKAEERLKQNEAAMSARLNIVDIKEQVNLKKDSLLEKEMIEHQQLKTIAKELDAVDELELLDLKKLTKNSLQIKEKNSKSIGRLNAENKDLNKAIKNIREQVKKLSKKSETKEIKQKKLELNKLLNSKINEKAYNASIIKKFTNENKRYDSIDKSFTNNYNSNISKIKEDIKELKRLEKARIAEYNTLKNRRDKKFKEAKDITDIALEDFRIKLKELKDTTKPADFKARYEKLTKDIKIKEKEINSIIAKEKFKLDNYMKEFDNYKKQLEIEAKKDLPSTSEAYALNKNQKAYVKDGLNQKFGTADRGEYKNIARKEIELIQKDSEKVLFKELDELLADLQQLKLIKKRDNIIDNIDNGVIKQVDEYKKRKLTDEEIYNLLQKDVKGYQKSIDELNFDDNYGFDNFTDVLNEIDRLIESGELEPTREILVARWTLRKYESYDNFLQDESLFNLSKEERLAELENQIDLHNQQIKADMEGMKKINYETKSDNLMKNSIKTRIKNILKGNTKERQELEAINIEGVSFLKDNEKLINELIDKGRTYAEIKETLIEKIKEYNDGALNERIKRKQEALTIKTVEGAEEVITKSEVNYEVDEDINNMYNNTIEQSNSALTQLPDEIVNEVQKFSIERADENGKVYIEEQEMTLKEYLEKNKKEEADLKKIFDGCVL